MSRTGLHPRRPDLAGFAASRGSFASPEKRASLRFSPRHLRTPALLHVRGLTPQKSSPDRGEAQATRTVSCTGALTRPGKVSRCCSAVAEGFSGRRPRCTQQRARGAEAAGQWTLPKACRLALAANRDPAQPSEAKAWPVFVFARCERGPDGGASEKPGVARAAEPARASTREKDEEQPVLVSMPGIQKERARASTRDDLKSLLISEFQ